MFDPACLVLFFAQEMIPATNKKAMENPPCKPLFLQTEQYRNILLRVPPTALMTSYYDY
jgi:hypothetical protein